MSVTLAGCNPVSPPPARTQGDPTAEQWYGKTVEELTALNSRAGELFRNGKADEAADLIVKGGPLSKRLISVSHPTLAATEAASDLDELYGRMLFSNRNYGWARILFQKNLARWKYWSPQTPEAASRLKKAQDEIAECDRQIAK